MSDFGNFYRAFEDRERGSRDLILGRLEAYRPLLESIRQRYPQARALDVGCGRGEWLHLLRSLGINGHGVDIDAGMLQACRDENLSVEQGDALEWLAAQPDNSLALISAFHVVEHIPFASVQCLVDEAHRVLLPGGLLIMETPNPENLSVGAHTFYLDPTHERPIPPALLTFVPEFVGFARTWLWRLQEGERLQLSDDPVLSNVLLAVSPDYAVIARKSAEEDMTALDQAISEPRGLGLEAACEKYDALRTRHFEYLAGSIERTQAGVEQTQSSVVSIQRQFDELQERLSQVEQKAEHLQGEALRYRAELLWVTRSFSWQVTYPLRWISLQWRLVKEEGLKGRTRKALRRVAAPTVRFVDRSTRNSLRLRHVLLSAARKLGIHHRLVHFYQVTRMEQAAAAYQGRVFELSESQKRSQSAWLPAARQLTVDELLGRIHAELKAQDGSPASSPHTRGSPEDARSDV